MKKTDEQIAKNKVKQVQIPALIPTNIPMSIPDPNSSPRGSILSKSKRSLEFPDSNGSSTMKKLKKKRVSFTDPVVSQTKEFLSSPNKSSSELEEQAQAQEKEKDPIPIIDGGAQQDHVSNKPPGREDDGMQNTGPKTLSFKDKNELIAYVTKNFSKDELLQQVTQTKVIDSQAKEQSFNKQKEFDEILKLMESNEGFKHKILESLPPEDILQYAFLKTAPKDILDKFSIEGIADYFIHKTNITGNEHEDAIKAIKDRVLVSKLIVNTQQPEKAIVQSREDLLNTQQPGKAVVPSCEDLLASIFKNTPVVEIFDKTEEFLRKFVSNH